MSAKRSAFLAVLVFAGLARPTPADDGPGKTKPESPKLDAFGDRLPLGAVVRFGTIRFRHDAKAVAFLDDKTIVSVGSSIRFWDATTGRLIREFRSEKMGNATDATISADHKRVIMRCTDSHYRVWDVGTGKLIREIKQSYDNTMRVSDDVTKAITSSANGSRFVALEAHMEPKETPIRAAVYSLDAKPEAAIVSPRGMGISGCVISPDGRQVVTAKHGMNDDNSSNTLTILDAGTAKVLRVDQPNVGRFSGLKFTPDGAALLVTGSEGASFRTVDGKELWRLTGQSHFSGIICMSARHVALYVRSHPSNEFEINVLDTASGKLIGRWPLPRQGIREAAMSPDGNRLVFVNGNSLHVVNLIDGKELVGAPGHCGTIWSIAVSSNGQFIASADGMDDADFLLWDMASGEIVRRFRWSGESPLLVLISPDGKLLAGTSLGGPVTVWDLTTGRDIVRLRDEKRSITGISFLDNSRLLAAVRTSDSDTTNFALCQIPSGKVVEEFTAPGQATPLGFFHRTDGRLLGIFDNFKTDMDQLEVPESIVKRIDVWDMLAKRTLRHLDDVPGNWVGCEASPDYRTVAMRSNHGAICMWELASGQHRLTIKIPEKLPEPELRGRPFAISPDGRTMAAVGNGEPSVDFWDLATGKRFASLRGHDLPIKTLKFTHDGRRLLTGSEDTTILGWDMTRPEWRSRTLSSNLSDKDLTMHWDRLRNGSAEEAYRSKWALAGDPKKTVEFLRTQLPSRRALSVERIKSWIADLDSDQYSVRERAQGELQSHFDQSEELLRKTVAGDVSAEVRSRINRILEANFAAIPQPDQLRELRAVEVLEQIGTPEARDLLRRLAASEVPTSISRDAVQSLKRLEARPR